MLIFATRCFSTRLPLNKYTLHFHTNITAWRAPWMAPATKRKRAGEASISTLDRNASSPPLLKRRSSARQKASVATLTDPALNKDVIDAPDALRASPDDGIAHQHSANPVKQEVELLQNGLPSEEVAPVEPPRGRSRSKKAKVAVAASEQKLKMADGSRENNVRADEQHSNVADATNLSTKIFEDKNVGEEAVDPEAGDGEEAGEAELKEAMSRPPPVNSDYLPLPWKGRLGYACLNTYLRQSNPPVFSSRTCRIQSILEHRHPLQDPSQPEHPTKNKPDRNKAPSTELGQRYVESLGLANAKDIVKMIRWNDRFGIKFFRLSSEMFPFASHPEYGYKLGTFAAETLAEAGRVVAELGHRVTTHPGQFTQLGSPRKPVIDNAIRDLEYHDELLSLLKLPDQLNRDAVMILHMGGMFEGKPETLQRFRENYAGLSQSVKNRLVLENDDMGWSVHDLLPVCEELNIPLVLDFHHHNIVFDALKIREGTKDIVELFPRIKATWDRKGIKQKMHYSEPTPPAITPRQRRKHSPRVMTLPPCAPDMDLMIEAKDKEQAVFELMRTFKLPGFDKIQDILPYTRDDDNKVALASMNRAKSRGPDWSDVTLIPADDVGMGGPEGRVYWPPTMEEWLRPKKREVKTKKDPSEKTTAQKKKEAAELYALREAQKKADEGEQGGEHDESDLDATPATKKAKAAMRKKAKAQAEQIAIAEAAAQLQDLPAATTQTKPKRKAKKQPLAVPTPSPSNEGEDEGVAPVKPPARKPSRRSVKGRVRYQEDDDDAMEVDA